MEKAPRLSVGMGLALLACAGDPFGLEPGTRYVLTSADGASPPVVRVLGPGTSLTLEADTIRILRNLAYTRSTTIVAENSAGVVAAEGSHRAAGASSVTERGVLERLGDRFVLRFECPDLAICVAPDTISFTPTGALIERSYLLNGARLEYDRR